MPFVRVAESRPVTPTGAGVSQGDSTPGGAAMTGLGVLVAMSRRSRLLGPVTMQGAASATGAPGHPAARSVAMTSEGQLAIRDTSGLEIRGAQGTIARGVRVLEIGGNLEGVASNDGAVVDVPTRVVLL